MRTLTIEEIATRQGCSVWTARRYAAAWIAAQHRADVPRATRVHTGKRGRPAYRIDASSFERWAQGTAPAHEDDHE